MNDLQRKSIVCLREKLKGAHYTNLIVRKNGEDHKFEADWLREVLDEYYEMSRIIESIRKLRNDWADAVDILKEAHWVWASDQEIVDDLDRALANKEPYRIEEAHNAS